MENNTNKYYYFIGREWSDTNKTEAFIEFDSIQELANCFESYNGNVDVALKDDEYVFSDNEYNEYYAENIKKYEREGK